MNYSNEVWICAEKRKRTATVGTSGDPHSVTTREGFDGLVAKTIQRKQTLRLHPGIYFTKGCWGEAGKFGGRLVMLGAGKSETKVELQITHDELPVASYAGQLIKRPDVAIMTLRPYGHHEPHRIEGVHFDASKITDPKIIISGGLNTESNTIAQDVKVSGVRGLWEPHPQTGLRYEAFSIRTVGEAGKSRVQSSEVVMAPDSYGNGITIGHVPNFENPFEQPEPSLVIGCSVDGVNANHCGYTASTSTRIVDCTSKGCNHGVYQDTAGARNILVENCHFESHWAGFRLHSHNERENYEGFVVRNTTVAFRFNDKGNGVCILFAATHTGNPGRFEGIDIQARVLNAPGKYYEVSASLPQDKLAYSVQGLGVKPGIINLPAWPVKNRKGPLYCVAMHQWIPGQTPA